VAKLSLFKHNRKPSELVDGSDIDVTPIMNMFIILIPFLVSMAVFTKLAILNFKVPSNTGLGLSKGKPKLKLTLVVKKNYILFTEGSKLLDSLAYIDKINPKNIKIKLNNLQDSVIIKNEAILAIDDDIIFDDIVAIMDVCKKTGFNKIGLSSSVK